MINTQTKNELLTNLDKLRLTELGIDRIKRNLDLDTDNLVAWCKSEVKNASNIIKKGKNWYVYGCNAILTINAYSYTIITAHKHIDRSFCV
jgi:hypothetical protein